MFTFKNEFVATPNSEHKYTNDRKEKGKMEYEMRRRKLLMFLFFMLNRRRPRCERTSKEVQKKKYVLKKYSRKDNQNTHLI